MSVCYIYMQQGMNPGRVLCTASSSQVSIFLPLSDFSLPLQSHGPAPVALMRLPGVMFSPNPQCSQLILGS